MGPLIIVGLLALIAIIFALMGLKIIQQGETKVSFYIAVRHKHHLADHRQAAQNLCQICA